MIPSARNILVTGGSGGIGAALVRAFHSAGDIVWFTYRAGRDRAGGEIVLRLDEVVDGRANPLWVYDDSEDADGPGGGDVAVDFWHSATFSWDGKIVNFIDESFGSGCPTVTPITDPATGATRDSDTGRMFFLDVGTGEKLSHFFIPRPGVPTDPHQYCSAHLGNTVPANRYLLVNAWYTGGIDVIDFTNPREPREIAFSDDLGDNWAAYWYEPGSWSVTGRLPIYASHGVEDPLTGDGFEIFDVKIGSRRVRVDHLNPQTQEFVLPRKAPHEEEPEGEDDAE
jgi:hypothetical protein